MFLSENTCMNYLNHKIKGISVMILILQKYFKKTLFFFYSPAEKNIFCSNFIKLFFSHLKFKKILLITLLLLSCNSKTTKIFKKNLLQSEKCNYLFFISEDLTSELSNFNIFKIEIEIDNLSYSEYLEKSFEEKKYYLCLNLEEKFHKMNISIKANQYKKYYGKLNYKFDKYSFLNDKNMIIFSTGRYDLLIFKLELNKKSSLNLRDTIFNVMLAPLYPLGLYPIYTVTLSLNEKLIVGDKNNYQIENCLNKNTNLSSCFGM